MSEPMKCAEEVWPVRPFCVKHQQNTGMYCPGPLIEALAENASLRTRLAAMEGALREVEKFLDLPPFMQPKAWADLQTLVRAARSTRCDCHSGSVCNEACANGICHDGCGQAGTQEKV